MGGRAGCGSSEPVGRARQSPSSPERPSPVVGWPVARRVTTTFPAAVGSVALARQFIRELEIGPAVMPTVELLVSELVTNAVVHGTGEVGLSVRLAEKIRVAVADKSPQRPRLAPSVGEPGPHGYGIFLVELLAEAWGVESTATGKAVWFEVLSDAPP